MSGRLPFAVALAFVGLGFGQAGAADPPKKTSPIVGSWRLLTIDGQEVIPTVYTFAADRMLQVSSQAGMARSTAELRYSTNETTDLARIDRLSKDAEYLGKDPLREGIFKIEGDKLTICYRDGGSKRPKKFGEEGAIQEVLERVKSKD
jgi:uncharacterized protein (TIGR03067 family)